MARRRRASKCRNNGNVSNQTLLWLLRLLVPLGGHKQWLAHHCFDNESLAVRLGMEEFVESERSQFPYRLVMADLRKRHAEAEESLRDAPSPPILSANMGRIARLVGLSETESRLLEFAVLLKTEPLLHYATELLGDIATLTLFSVLSALLDVPEMAVKASLSSNGILARSGLLTIEREEGARSLPYRLGLLSGNFSDLMVTDEVDPLMLLRQVVRPGMRPRLSLADFDHVREIIAMLQPYLEQACANGQRGANILIHGAPGTGKSELSRVMAREIDCELFEVSSEDSAGDPVEGRERFRSLLAAQHFFAQQQVLLVFDEVEDVFNDGYGRVGGRSTAQARKAWVNRVLEDNPVPTIWISNQVGCIDPAFVRRFDMVIEMPMPPRKQRERIVRDVCGDMLPETSVKRIADTESLAPAVISRAAMVVRAIQDKLPQAAIPGAVERLVSSTLEAQGHAPLRANDANRLPEFYDPAFVNASADLAAVTAGIAKSKFGRLCLFGPPGTGKTAFGRWLAGQLNMPLCVRRGSDLISMWVGSTEKNIAHAFREAERDGALLLIDEVDGFLQDRRNAHRSWEVTAVNEMLTQMESFSGVFIASTNLMGGLDQAALRRFDLKVEFGFLNAEQAWRLFEQQCMALGLGRPDARLAARFARLDRLTPGDYAAVARQHRFHPAGNATGLLARLADECEIKEGGKSAIGFI
jgi:SpoVK/Ycf46/Vps4 family AAA+-type ATPase